VNPQTQTTAVRPPVQARSRRTLSRILDATTTLLAEKGRDALTVQDIVARAKTSVGSFYARFSGKDELLAYLEAGVWTRARGEWDEALSARVGEGSSLGERIRAVVALLVEVHQDEAFKHWSSAGKEAGDGVEFARHMRESVARVLIESRSQIRHPEPQRAVALGYAAVTGALRERPDGWEDRALIEELSRLWRSYLGGGKGDDRGSAAVDYFQVWG
jgi:AcrR family transcriptional regulator